MFNINKYIFSELTNIMLFIITLLLLINGFATSNLGMSAIAVFFMWGVAMLSAIADKERNIMYIFFLATFFVFLLSKVMVSWLVDHELYMSFSIETMEHIYLVLMISLAGLWLGSKAKVDIVWGTENYTNKSYLSLKDKVNLYSLKKIIKPLTIITGLCKMLVVLEMLAFYQVGFGGELRVNFFSTLPFIVIRFSQFYIFTMCLYLALLPSKKESTKILLFYLAIAALKMGYGSRGDFVLGLMFMFVYFSIRDRLRTVDEELWIGKKEKTLAIASVPVLIIILVFVGVYRTGNEFEFTSFIDTLWRFFESQGVSIDILGYSYEHANQLPQPGVVYLFGNTYHFLTTNPIMTELFGMKAYAMNTVERALYGSTLSMSLYYIINPISYLDGKGGGSSYVAEVFLAFGYFGTFVVNFLFSYILGKLNRYNFDSVWKSTILLIFIQSLFFMPRAGFDDFVGDFATFSHLIYTGLIYIMYRTNILGA